ncbi:MAG: SIMPL domain-containing protein [Gammaproteobacteria bacterium]|nr:SIMPL domain-containing protein [Gammaproteobacteria bacterium]
MKRILLFIIIWAVSVNVMAADHAVERTVTVSGQGAVTLQPDLARISVSVEARNTSLPDAQEKVATVTAKLLKVTDDLGIDRTLVSTTGATLQPDYRWDRDKGVRELVGYIAERRIEVELRDLANLGPFIESAVAAGANQVSPPSFDSTQRREAYRAALVKAAEDARQNAQQLADSFGARLGAVIRVNASGESPRPRVMRAQADMAVVSEAAVETYNTADIRFDASVNAQFELK